jgi:hypothetical protein
MSAPSNPCGAADPGADELGAAVDAARTAETDLRTALRRAGWADPATHRARDAYRAALARCYLAATRTRGGTEGR